MKESKKKGKSHIRQEELKIRSSHLQPSAQQTPLKPRLIPNLALQKLRRRTSSVIRIREVRRRDSQCARAD